MRRALVVALFLFATGIGPAHALRLPLRSYGPAEGLADAGVYRVRIGPAGFVWIATLGGLWRFDGERFDVLGPGDGVPRGQVFDFAFTQDGSLWIASEAGLFHGDPARIVSGRPTFSEVLLVDATRRELPHRLAPAADGSVWVGTFQGLWHVTPSAPGALAQRFALGVGTSPPETSRVQALAIDPSGAVWVGTASYGVYRLGASGKVDRCGNEVEGCSFVRDFLFDGEGGVWAAYLGGLARFDIATFAAGVVPNVILRPSDGLPGIDTEALFATAPDHLLLASTAGITEIDRDASGRWKAGATLDRRSGLPGDNVSSLARDAAGNLWIGFVSGGLTKRIAGGFVEQDDAEEPGTRIMALGRGRDGRLIVMSAAGALRWTIRIVSRDRTETYPLPPLPKGFVYVGWGRQQLLAQEANGAWWVATGGGAMRFGGSPGGKSQFERPHDGIVDMNSGLPSPDVYVLFLDAAGDLWVSTNQSRPGMSGVAQVRQARGPAKTFSAAEMGSTRLAVGFAEDGERQLWIAFVDGTLVRRRNGRFERIACPFKQLDAAPFVVDARGRLWILGDTLAVVDHPGDEHAEARPFALPEALADISFMTGVDDGTGTLYLGTSRGVLRLEPDSGRARLLTAADGLVPGIIHLAARDGDGVLWFSDESGLSRYKPGPDPPPERHAPRIREVRVAGIPSPVPAMGAASIGPLTIEPSQRSIEIGYFAVHQGPGEPPRFQHRLIGTEADWSAPTSARSVLYAGLAPGRYRFGVRTVEANDRSASEPAIVEFHVLAPIWLRGWFVVLAAAATAGLAYGAHRLRVARVVAIERVRTRIATDLHDEIGSSLSQISVLSQVAERDAVRASGSAPRALSRIAELARGVTESVGETVWAISPREDRLSDLVHRMRRFALDLFADGGVDIALELPSGDAEERLDPEIRRTLYLVFKEALHNARKHAAARKVDVALRRSRFGLELRVADDGKGFDPSAPSRGHGLDGMRRRAEAIGGRFEVLGGPGGGTTIVFLAPVGVRNLFRRIVGRRGGGA
jgi:signal transduction histidine kinase/ligand-binding sensor domain-containing protein